MTNALLSRHEAAARTLPQAKLIIGGKDVVATSLAPAPHVNATTGRPQGEIVMGGAAEADAAIAAARRALPGWWGLGASARRDALLRLADIIAANGAELSILAALENGSAAKSFLDFQLPMVVNWFRYYAGWADKLDGAFAGGWSGTDLGFEAPEPFGVIAIVLPWNAPLGSLCMKAAPALAAGNTLVVKPPETAPYLAIRFGELVREAGFPDGVVNILVGGVEAGEALSSHAGIDKISFTGSAATASRIMGSAARHLTPTVFELGGKSANIVFADADLDAAAAYSATYPFTNAGQICVCPSRLIVQDAVYDEFLGKIAAVAGGLKIGDPLVDDTFTGPMISEGARERVLAHVDRARAQPGVELVSGGTRGEDDLADGWFLRPTILADPDPASEISQTELFGPVVVVHRFKTEAQALEIANGTEYGLAAYVQSRDIEKALRVARDLRSGGVYVNGAFPLANPGIAFGGVGASGYGREGGRAGIDEFVRTKSVAVQIGAR